MNKLTNILAVLVALGAIYAGNKVLNDTAMAMSPKTENTLKSDSSDDCTQTVEVIDGESYPHEECK